MNINLDCGNSLDIQKIANATGRTVSAITNEALGRWLEKEGSVVLDRIEASAPLRANLIKFKKRRR